ncbi:MAG: RagB/SusD family nutrient uptake outer membrane protein [Bacteroidetes bacterium]|nr:RagB/SusD family nutrient uptake outer membrane protein [Bacteroidota bacterium]
MKKINIAILIVLIVGVLTGCKKGLLDVQNQNDPDFATVLSNGNDVKTLAGGLFVSIYYGEHSYNGINMMLAVAADNASCSWGNAGMRDMSWEPRDHAWDNSPAYGNRGYTKTTFDAMYAAINTASQVMKALESGVEVENDAQVKAFAKFAQGVAYGNLALIFDRAFIIDETKTVEPKLESAVDYKQVATAAIGYLNDAIAFCAASFTIPKTWLGTAADLSNNDLKALCNTMAARILAYLPRNKTELAAVNWAQVKTYADAGINSDFNVINDNYVNFYDEAGDYLVANGWGVVDMYTVHMMDPVNQPQHWDDTPAFPYPAASVSPIDQRLNTDFEYIAANWFQVARGYYHFSSYRCARYDAMYVNATGPKPEVMKAENDMLRAEARAYTSDLAGAAAIINASTRKTRGNMPDVAANLTDIVDAIHHERFVEMFTSGVGLQFFEMRSLNLLQKGTPLHMPVPAGTQETLSATKPFYTFGYLKNADGIGTSNAGWR